MAVAVGTDVSGRLTTAATCDPAGKLAAWGQSGPMSRACAAALAERLLEATTVLSYGGTSGLQALQALTGDARLVSLAGRHRAMLRDVASDLGAEPSLKSFAAVTLGAEVTAASPLAAEAATLSMLWNSEDAQRFGKLRHRHGVWVLPAGRSTIRPAADSRPLKWG